MNKIKISNFQFAITTSGFVFGAGPLFLSSGVATIAGRDGWISFLVATIIGLLSVWINTCLMELFPDKTLIEITCLLLGKWFGNIISIILIFLAITTGIQIIWYVGDFVTTTAIPDVSAYPINILFIAALVIALLYGLEAMFRATTIYFFTLFPIYVSTLLLLIPKIKIDNILPFFENGISPVLKGAIPPLSLSVWPMIILTMVTLSNFSDPKKAKRSMLYGYLLGMFTGFAGALMCILVMGDTVTANLRYPLFVLCREVNVGTIFTRFEVILEALWLTSNFISTFFLIYMGIKGLSQVLKLNDYKNIVIPFGLIMAVYSQIIYKNVPHQIHWDSETWPITAFTAWFIYPVILLIVFTVRKLLNKSTDLLS